MLRDWRCPVFDRAVSALLGDLADRGLLDETTVCGHRRVRPLAEDRPAHDDNVGPGGRDHWPECYTCLIAGGGVRAGRFTASPIETGPSPSARRFILTI